MDGVIPQLSWRARYKTGIPQRGKICEILLVPYILLFFDKPAMKRSPVSPMESPRQGS